MQLTTAYSNVHSVHLFIHSLIHSVIQTISIAPLQIRFYSEAPQATVSYGLAQGPYVAVRVGFEPTTLQSKGSDSTNALPHPTRHHFQVSLSGEVLMMNE